MAYSRTYFTVETNGQTLAISATAPTGSAGVLHLTTAVSSAVTQPYTITSDTTFYILDEEAGDYIISAKQPDGTELYGNAVKLQPGDPKTIAPSPSALQIAADIGQGAWGRYASGYYYLTSQSYTAGTNTFTVGLLRLGPWWLPQAVTLSKIGAEVTSAGGAGSVFRIGLYSDTGLGYPGALVQDFGTIDGTSATVQDIDLDPDVTLAAGMYWVGGAAQVGTQPTMRVHGVAGHPASLSLGTSTPSAGAAASVYTQSSVTGALPATFTTTRAIGGVTGYPRIHFKVA